MRSMLSYRLFITDTTLGALNPLLARTRCLQPAGQEDGRLFATHAPIALAGARTDARLSAVVDTRDVIGMAKGILMQRHDLDAVAPFRMLVERRHEAAPGRGRRAPAATCDRTAADMCVAPAGRLCPHGVIPLLHLSGRGAA